jgi:probable HAF family extracellular repeat protein
VVVGLASAPAGAGAQAAPGEPVVAVTELGGVAARFLPREVNRQGQVLGRRFVGGGSGGDVSLYDRGRFVTLAPAPRVAGLPNLGRLNERGEAVVAVRWWLATIPIRCTSSLWSQERTTSVSALDTACASDLNDNGQVLLNPIVPDGDSWWLRPSVWSAGRRTYSPQPPAGSAFTANAIGDSGLVVGFLEGTGGREPALWQPGGPVTPLGSLGGHYGEARAVTPDGAVFGMSETGDGSTRVFVWRATTGMVDLGAPEGSSTTIFRGVNDRGHVVVESGTQTFVNDQGDTVTMPGGSTYLWRDGAFVEVEHDAGLQFRGINDRDQIALDNAVRDAQDVRRSPTSRAFAWDGGTMIDLDAAVGGDATSTAEAINDNGQVVGTDGDGSADGPRRGVMWSIG